MSMHTYKEILVEEAYFFIFNSDFIILFLFFRTSEELDFYVIAGRKVYLVIKVTKYLNF